MVLTRPIVSEETGFLAAFLQGIPTKVTQQVTLPICFSTGKMNEMQRYILIAMGTLT